MTMAGRSRSSRRQRAAQQAATTEAFANAFDPPTAAAPAAAAAAAAAAPAAAEEDQMLDLSEDDEDDGGNNQAPPLAVQPTRNPRASRNNYEDYKPSIVKFLNWLRPGSNFTNETELTPAILAGITAQDFYRWCKFRVYDDPDANELITPPNQYRHNSVLAWKKHVSFFMPNSNMQWNEVALVGNPTKSSLMSKLIKNMKRMQTRRLGVPSQARRDLTQGEFERLQAHYWSMEKRELGICAAALAATQLHLIGRNDDLCHFKLDDLLPYDAFPQFAVTGRLAWSKNVTDERDAPRQVLLGANDPRYCVLSALALWLEFSGANYAPNDLLFAYDGDSCPERVKAKMQDAFKSGMESITKDKPGNVGTHSIRKMAGTFAVGNGCTQVCFVLCFIIVYFMYSPPKSTII